MSKRKIGDLAQKVVIASDYRISYEDAFERAKGYYSVRRRSQPFSYLWHHFSTESIARNMANGMLNRV